MNEVQVVEEQRKNLTSEICELQETERSSFQAAYSCAGSIAFNITRLSTTFDKKSDLYGWAEKNFGYKKTSVNEYLKIQANFLNRHAGQPGINSINFRGLVALSKKNLSEKAVAAVVRYYAKTVENTDKYPLLTAVQIKARLKKNLNHKTARSEETDEAAEDDRVHLIPTFPHRLKECIRVKEAGGEPIGGSFLFGLRSDATVADVKIMAKYYKQKYHTDKGGTDVQFALISEYASQFISEQKLKGVHPHDR